MKYFLLIAAVFTVLAGFPAYAAETAQAEIIDGGGVVIGSAHFTQGPIGVLAEVEVKDLPPGKHGFHIHATGTCEAHDHFKSATGHINSQEKAHGYLNEGGPEKGDLPNLIVAADGRVAVELFLPQLDLNEMLDEDGSALVIHADPDDHMTQPIGGAGDRIACGVVQK